MQPTNHDRAVDGGMSLAELLMGVVVFVVAALVLGNHITVNYNASNTQRDKVFAYTKAQAILSEIHAFVDRGEIEAAVDLDVLDDGNGTRPELTVTRDANDALLAADHPLSGNMLRDGAWVWSRRISVRPFAGINNRNVRYVTVQILKRSLGGAEHELASLSSVVNSVGSSYPTSQVFDVYLLAIENVPGWWVYMEAITPFIESAITDLENRNPGLEVRTHWITKLGFGRNRAYRPFINDQSDSQARTDWTYWYPGRMPDGSASSYYYAPDLIKARMLVDADERGGWDPDLNPYPYALADQFNHAMRYPRAKAYNDARVAAIRQRKDEINTALANGWPPPAELYDMSEEPPLQILLEEMNSSPEKYRNALFINLHGELLPAPPLRNYSDPAKRPDVLPGVRVVAHPEELRTARPTGVVDSGDDVKIRVYAYMTSPTDYTGPEQMADDTPILLEIMDMDLTDGALGLKPGVTLQCLQGGVDIGFGRTPYRPLEAAKMQFDPDCVFEEMNYMAFFNDPGFGERKSTVIALFHTPLVANESGDHQGLHAHEQSHLYGLQYVPSCTGPGLDFTHDLSASGHGPKNTARWVLTIPKTSFVERQFLDTDSPPNGYDPRTTSNPDYLLTIRTRIGDPLLAGAMSTWLSPGTWPSGDNPLVVQPDNFSETYTWWADSPEDVPISERSQFIGDPRHNPYKDLLAGDPDFGNGYNWFFDSLLNGEDGKADYPGIANTFDLYNGALRQDVPRTFEVFRNALIESEAVFTSLSGYSYFYVGYGNEIGYDAANGYPSSIPVNLLPWGGGDTTGFVDNVNGQRTFIRSGGADYWWGMPWLGELYPDWAYSTDFMAVGFDGTLSGNLRAGTAADRFQREDCEAVYSNNPKFLARGTRMTNANQRTDTRGCVSLFNIGFPGAHFNHHVSGSDGALVGAGNSIAMDFGFPVPMSAYINRPFTIDTSGNEPPECGFDPYASRRAHARILQTFFNHGSDLRTGSGLIELSAPDNSSAGYLIVNGFAETPATGPAFLAKYSMLAMLQSYFELGDTSLPHRIEQLPRVEIVDPTEVSEIVDPASIDVLVELEWTRWDRLPYTRTTPETFEEDESEIFYVFMYSDDEGVHWRYAVDGTPAIPGMQPTNAAHRVADAGAGPEIFNWPTASLDFPEGSYLLRVEAFRQGQTLHYASHQVNVYIDR